MTPTGDGCGDTSMPLETCDAPGGYAKADGDCNDGDGARFTAPTPWRPVQLTRRQLRRQHVDEGCMAECNRVVHAGHRYFCRSARR
ncbi:MAG: hypothetical protein R3B99_18940 [Polyangiales bacterium]